MTSIIAHIGQEPYRTEIKTTTNTLIADEPVSNGGGDTGFTPEELLAASLGACTSITLRMYAVRKGWTGLKGIQVNVDFKRDITTNTTELDRRIILEGDISAEQTDRLLVIANKCPIHQTLTHAINVRTEMISANSISPQ